MHDLVAVVELVGKMDLRVHKVQVEPVAEVMVDQMVEMQELLELIIQVVEEVVLQEHLEKVILVVMEDLV